MHDRACEAAKKDFCWYISNIPHRAMVFVDDYGIRKEDPQEHEDCRQGGFTVLTDGGEKRMRGTD